MSVLYVTHQGAVVTKRGQRLVVIYQNETLQEVQALHLEQVALFGKVHITPHVIAYLLERGVDTVFLSTGGKFRGRLVSQVGKNVELRQQQFRRSDDNAFLVDLAHRYVRGKLHNCRTLLRRQQRQAQQPMLEAAMLRLRHAMSKLDRVETLDEVRGWEGSGAAAYFDCFPYLLPTEFPFAGRSRRPPKDAVNALLSFGYTLLVGTITTAVQTVGLDPYLGSLHALENGKPSLVLDLMEEFRPLLVDTPMFRAIHRRQIVPHDFVYGSDEYPVRMHPDGLRKWILIYEATLRQRLTYPRLGANLTYRDICLEQARLLARHIRGEEPYESFILY